MFSKENSGEHAEVHCWGGQGALRRGGQSQVQWGWHGTRWKTDQELVRLSLLLRTTLGEGAGRLPSKAILGCMLQWSLGVGMTSISPGECRPSRHQGRQSERGGTLLCCLSLTCFFLAPVLCLVLLVGEETEFTGRLSSQCGLERDHCIGRAGRLMPGYGKLASKKQESQMPAPKLKGKGGKLELASFPWCVSAYGRHWQNPLPLHPYPHCQLRLGNQKPHYRLGKDSEGKGLTPN